MDAVRKTPLWIAVVATAASAVLFYFGTGIYAVAALTWLAPVPVLWLAPRVSARAAFLTSAVAGLLGATNNLIWYITSPSDAPLWPMGLMIMLAYSLTFALGVLPYRALLLRGRALLAAVTLPAAWTVVLWIVSVSNPTGIMGTLASAQGDVPLVLQTTTVTGMWGLEFLVLFVPAGVAALFAPSVGAGARWRTAGVTVVVAGLVLGLGAWRLVGGGEGPSQTVALLSNNDSGWGARLDQPVGEELVAKYEKRIAALPDGVEAVVLPEGEFTADPKSLGVLVEPMRRLAKDEDLTIVVGAVYKDEPKQYNNALVIPPTGDVVTYTKHHDGGPNTLGTELAFQPGHGKRVGIAICADLNFPNPARQYGVAGARALLVPAADERYDGWLHARAGVLQAVANGSSMVWAGRTGTLTVTDGYGRVLAEKDSGGAGEFTQVVAEVPEGPGTTVYSRYGDWFVWLCIGLVAVGTVLALGRRRGAAAASGRPTEPVRSGDS